MSKLEVSEPIITCAFCGKVVKQKPRGKHVPKYCDRICANKDIGLRSAARIETITKTCLQCGKEFSFRSVGPVNDVKRRFCSNPCAAVWRNSQPGRQERFKQWIAPHHGHWKGKRHPTAKAWMQQNNPMKSPESVEKMRRSLSGRTFLARGGNGSLTKPQILLAGILGLPMEYAIRTTKVRGLFPSLPNHYKVDIADPLKKVAIEVDGNSHKLKTWKFLDKRKVEILNALGWSVLRFWNQDVLKNPEAVAQKVRTFIASKSTAITTSSPPGF